MHGKLIVYVEGSEKSVELTGPDTYNVFKETSFAERTMKILVPEGSKFYALTFG